MAEKTDPELVRTLLNTCFDYLVPLIEKYDGTVDKFVGDAIVAFFGAPVAHEDDPERALRAALERRESWQDFNAQHYTALALHIGINTGLAITGGLGSEGRQHYSVVGDAINLASRLEELSELGEILVGPHTHRLTAFAFDFEERPPIQVKGKEEAVVAYRLLGHRAASAGRYAFGGLRPPWSAGIMNSTRSRRPFAFCKGGREDRWLSSARKGWEKAAWWPRPARHGRSRV